MAVPFSQDALSVLVVVAGGVAVLALLVAAALSVRLSRIRRAYALVYGRGPAQDVVSAVARHVEEAATLRAEVGGLRTDARSLGEALRAAVQHVGLVRYDAFEDMGGHLSFSAALLDGGGSGVVLTTINGRTESRVYAKPVEGGDSRYNLSAEEEEAIRRAFGTPRR